MSYDPFPLKTLPDYFRNCAASTSGHMCFINARVSLAMALIPMALAGIRAQYFKPFTSASVKLFLEDTLPADAMSLAFDTAYADGSDSVFVHFGALNTGSTLIDPLCTGWGSPYCFKTDLPLWSGTLFRTDNAGRYLFGTVNNDTLDLAFNGAPGVPQVFFQDNVQVFSCTKLGLDTMTVLGMLDSVYTYVIAHTDTDGVAIPSALDQATIVIGKEVGLVSFFQVDSFPVVLKPLQLIGNKGPDLGFHRITKAMVYDFQPGDIVQTRRFIGSGYPPLPFSYSKTTYLSRLETADSLIYSLDWMHFTASGSWTSGYAITKYSKNEVLFELPFTRFDGTFRHLRLSQSDWCPTPLWVFQWQTATDLYPCEFGDCWIAYDTQGPPPDESGSYILGGGSGRYYYEEPLFQWELPYWDIDGISYMRKNGIDCGHEEHVGMPEGLAAQVVSLAPNPASTEVRILSSEPVRSVALVDIHGREFKYPASTGVSVVLDLRGLQPGIYIVRIGLQNGAIVRRSLVVTN